MRLAALILAAVAGLSTAVFAGETAQLPPPMQAEKPMVLAAGGSCGSWKSTCEGRGGGANCTAKYNSCLKSGCFTEGEKWGGATHCGLAKK